MNILKLMTASFFAGILFAGCAAPTTFVDSTWTVQPQSVKVVFTEPEVDDLGDLKDDLPEYADNFSEWFKIQVTQAMNEKAGSKVSFSAEETKSVGGENVVLNGTEIKVPKLDETSDDADVYLVMDKIWFGRETVENVGSGAAMGTGASGFGMGFGATTSSKYFKAKCKFSFYDVKTKMTVGYGKAEGASSYTFAVTKSDWEYALSEMVKVIVDKTPIVK